MYELIAKLWNSELFNPIALPSHCHSDFAVAIDCSHQQVAGLQPATPQKIADCLALIRNDLLKIIPKWEQSGQGEGGRDNEQEESNEDEQEHEDDSLSTSITSLASNNSSSRRQSIASSVLSPSNAMGSLSHRPARALHTRSYFLGRRPSYVLYYWEVVDAHQLLRSSLQQLTNNAGAANASAAPSTVSSTGSRTTRRQRDDDQQEQERRMAPLVASIDKLAAIHEGMAHERARDKEQLKELEDKRASLEMRRMERKRKFERICELRDLAGQYRRERIQLDSKGENFAVLRDFYDEEITSIEDELGELVDAPTADDNAQDNN